MHLRLNLTLNLTLASTLVLASCGPQALAEEPPHFLWTADPQSLENPFPDERLLVDGVLDFRPKWFSPFLPSRAVTAKSVSYFNKVAVQAGREIHALGHFGSTLIRLSERIDPDSLKNCAARLAKKADGTWVVLERDVVVGHPRDEFVKRGLSLPEDFPEFIFTKPSVPLPDGQEGLLVLLAGPKSLSGISFGRGRDWSTHAVEAKQRDEIAAVLGLNPAEIVLMLPQRAGDLHRTPKALAAWAQTHPPAVVVPEHAMVADDGAPRPVGVWKRTDPDWNVMGYWLEKYAFSRPTTNVGQVIIGELSARDLRLNGVFNPAWVENPSLAPIIPLRFVATVPAGPRPPQGWPMVMGQHGSGARNTPRSGLADAFCLEWAQALAARGFGCVGIDAPSHGSRGAYTTFFSVEDMPAMRDRFREMTFDLLQVEAALQTLDVDGDGTPDVAPRLRYFGHSLGAMTGADFLSVSSHVSTAVLNVPGGGLSNVVMSRFLQDLIGLLFVAQTDIAFDSPEYLASFPLFRALAQPFFDPGDPVTQAQWIDGNVAVMLQAGKGDKVIPMQTSVDLAHAMRLDFEASSTGPRVFVPVDPALYLPPEKAQGYNPHYMMWDLAPVREQALEFLESDGQVVTR